TTETHVEERPHELVFHSVPQGLQQALSGLPRNRRTNERSCSLWTYKHLVVLLKHGFRFKAVSGGSRRMFFPSWFVSPARNGKICLLCGPQSLLKVLCIVRLTTQRNSKKIAMRVLRGLTS